MKGLLIAVLAVGGCHAPSVKSAPVAVHTGGARVGEVQSNILRADYAGSRACERCHAEIFGKWFGSPMHHMTRLPDGASVQAPFDGGLFRFKDDQVKLEQHEGARFMRISSVGAPVRLYRVTKVIGGHHREDFAGVEVDETQPGTPPVGDPHNERVLPATFMIGARAWRYKGYSVMTRERPGLRAGAVWNKTCIFCHNTEPYLSNLLGALAGPGTPPYQGEVVDPLLPPARRASFEITDGPALRRAVGDEIRFLHARPLGDDRPVAELLGQAVRVTRAAFNESHLVEVGIGCESCHGGSREHVEHVGVTPVYEPRSAFLRARLPDGDAQTRRAREVNRVCARCHQVLFSKYPWTWEGAQRSVNPGGSHINSGEGRDFLLGGCSSAMSCVACHDPHAPDNAQRMQSVDGAVCLGCHVKYAGAEAQRAHSHHDPAGAGGQCLNCHLPKKNMSLDNGLTRYHRIGSPDDPVRVEKDRPLECALCHVDETVEKLVATMESWWGKRYDRAALRALYPGDLAVVKPLLATLRVGKPHEQATAMGVLGEHAVRAAAPLEAVQLTHSYPILRYFAAAALERTLGRATGIDLFQNNGAIRAQAERYLRGLGVEPERSGPPSVPEAPPLPETESTAQ